MNKQENNFAFIDIQNVHLSMKRNNWLLDWYKFHIYLQDKFKCTKAFIFIGFIEKYENFYKKLESIGYILIFKEVTTSKGVIKGNVDAELVLHTAAIEYLNYQKAIIVSGDGDFACLIKFLQDNDKLEALVIPDEFHYSSLLKKFSLSDDNLLIFLNRSQLKLKKL
jgi:uncharacterized LabA/DUF88 family protein